MAVRQNQFDIRRKVEREWIDFGQIPQSAGEIDECQRNQRRPQAPFAL